MPPPTRSLRPLMLAAALLSSLTVASACGPGGHNVDARATAGPARSFMMGLSTLPRDLNADSYAATFDLAASNGEAVLIQRTPPWADFVPGGAVGDETAQTTASEKQALQDHDLQLFFAIDPTDGSTGRDRLAALPNALAGRNFADPDIRSAFVSYAQYVALNYRPRYLALGVEMNLYYQKNKDDFESFRTLYEEARARVKETSPDTQVTVTFQYEDLQGMLPTEDEHYPDWPLLRQFDPIVDVTAISTYPSFAFARAGDIPANYYSRLTAYTDRPIVIAEMGYASALGVRGINNGTEADQAEFVRRGLAEAQALNMPLVIWFAAWDPAYARDTAFSVFQHIGLLRADNTEKPAWAVWADAALRPYEPG